METVEEPVLRVLCADDNYDSADSLTVLLEMSGIEVQTRYNGRAALEAAELFHPDVCILDLEMPGLGGDEVGQRIREKGWGRYTILVALTGLPEEEARRRTATAGFDLHLSKPADPELLANTIIDIAILRGPTMPPPPPGPRLQWPHATAKQ